MDVITALEELGKTHQTDEQKEYIKIIVNDLSQFFDGTKVDEESEIINAIVKSALEIFDIKNVTSENIQRFEDKIIEAIFIKKHLPPNHR